MASHQMLNGDYLRLTEHTDADLSNQYISPLGT